MSKFTDSIENLAENVGRRNGMLLPVAHLGIREGMTDGAIVDAIVEGGGNPPLTREEVVRAVSRARESRTAWTGFTDEQKALLFAKQNSEAARIECSSSERGYVRRMIDIGKSLGNPFATMYKRCSGTLDILAKVPGNVDRTPQKFQLFSAWARKVHKGDPIVFATWSPREPRDEFHTRRLSEILSDVEHHNIPTPVLMSTNTYTGDRAKTNTKLGYSLASKKTVDISCNALLEFDSFDDVNDKFYFAAGLVASGDWPVVSCVYSGNKSVHIIIRTPIATDLLGTVDKEATSNEFSKAWRKIERYFCSSPDPSMRCDALCKDPTRMTRCAWAMRGMRNRPDAGIPYGDFSFNNEPMTTNQQTLLYLNEEDV